MAEAGWIRAQVAYERTSPAEAVRIALEAAAPVLETEPDLAVSILTEAAWCARDAADPPLPLHFHATDAPGEWVARREPDMVVLERTHTKADVAVRGPAAELLLVLSRRRPLDAAPTLELHGDRALFDHWIEHMDWVTNG